MFPISILILYNITSIMQNTKHIQHTKIYLTKYYSCMLRSAPSLTINTISYIMPGYVAEDYHYKDKYWQNRSFNVRINIYSVIIFECARKYRLLNVIEWLIKNKVYGKYEYCNHNWKLMSEELDICALLISTKVIDRESFYGHKFRPMLEYADGGMFNDNDILSSAKILYDGGAYHLCYACGDNVLLNIALNKWYSIISYILKMDKVDTEYKHDWSIDFKNLQKRLSWKI